MDRASRGRAVEQLDEVAVLSSCPVLVAVLHRLLEPLEDGLRSRPVPHVFEPLASGGLDASFLLLDVRHRVKRPAEAGAAIVAAGRPRPRQAQIGALDLQSRHIRCATRALAVSTLEAEGGPRRPQDAAAPSGRSPMLAG
jgi:hypothetical protein